MLDALQAQWAQFPPLPMLIADFLGASKRKGPQLADPAEQDVMPTTRLSAAEFDAVVASMGLPARKDA